MLMATGTLRNKSANMAMTRIPKVICFPPFRDEKLLLPLPSLGWAFCLQHLHEVDQVAARRAYFLPYHNSNTQNGRATLPVQMNFAPPISKSRHAAAAGSWKHSVLNFPLSPTR